MDTGMRIRRTPIFRKGNASPSPFRFVLHFLLLCQPLVELRLIVGNDIVDAGVLKIR